MDVHKLDAFASCQRADPCGEPVGTACGLGETPDWTVELGNREVQVLYGLA